MRIGPYTKALPIFYCTDLFIFLHWLIINFLHWPRTLLSAGSSEWPTGGWDSLSSSRTSWLRHISTCRLKRARSSVLCGWLHTGHVKDEPFESDDISVTASRLCALGDASQLDSETGIFFLEITERFPFIFVLWLKNGVLKSLSSSVSSSGTEMLVDGFSSLQDGSWLEDFWVLLSELDAGGLLLRSSCSSATSKCVGSLSTALPFRHSSIWLLKAVRFTSFISVLHTGQVRNCSTWVEILNDGFKTAGLFM